MKKIISTEIPVPFPADWAKSHSQLLKAWILKEDRKIPKPPMPLILAGAAFSSADDIRTRWIDLIKWANEYGFASILIANLPESPDYDIAVSITGVTAYGKNWWPEISEQFHQPKEKPSKEIIWETLKRLKFEWQEIVGIELGKETIPKKFTGKKDRRLVVIANPEFTPPWGCWYSSNRNPNAFSKFRKTINAAIFPLEVDVIDFNTESWLNAANSAGGKRFSADSAICQK